MSNGGKKRDRSRSRDRGRRQRSRSRSRWDIPRLKNCLSQDYLSSGLQWGRGVAPPTGPCRETERTPGTGRGTRETRRRWAAAEAGAKHEEKNSPRNENTIIHSLHKFEYSKIDIPLIISWGVTVFLFNARHVPIIHFSIINLYIRLQLLFKCLLIQLTGLSRNFHRQTSVTSKCR